MNAELKTKVEQFLKKTITKVEQWVNVLFVIQTGKRPTFVSLIKFHKFVLESNFNKPEFKVLEPLVWTLESTTRRAEGKKWVARITGLDDKYTLARQFINPFTSKWGKRGVAEASFKIDAPGFYQDSDKEYFKVFVNQDGEFDAEIVSYDDVYNHFGVVPRCYR